MNLKIKLSLLLLYAATIATSQVDTLSIANELSSFKTPKDHNQFWKTIYRQDQHFRGDQTVDSIDLRNIVKASMYFNKYGYPTIEKAGKESSIINYVWIHNGTPKIDELTFDIILTGYLKRRISEDDFRNYYIRKIYKREFNDRGFRNDSIKNLLEKLNLESSERIKIEELLIEYQKSQNFLLKELNEYGLWIGESTFDTLYLNGNPIINEIKSDSIRIAKDKMNNYYIQFLYEDGSHYPQRLIKIKNKTFKIFEDSESHFQILSNGDLRVIDNLGKEKRYTPHKTR